MQIHLKVCTSSNFFKKIEYALTYKINTSKVCFVFYL